MNSIDTIYDLFALELANRTRAFSRVWKCAKLREDSFVETELSHLAEMPSGKHLEEPFWKQDHALSEHEELSEEQPNDLSAI